MYLLLLAMPIVNILYNIVILLVILISFIPLMVWNKKDFNNINEPYPVKKLTISLLSNDNVLPFGLEELYLYLAYNEIILDKTNLFLLSKLKILDIGTGSGCIPIVLKKNLPLSSITAIDISNEALKIAQLNDVIRSFESFKSVRTTKDY